MPLSVGQSAYRILFGKRSHANMICRIYSKNGTIELIPWVKSADRKQWALKIIDKSKGEYAYLLFEHSGVNAPSMDDCLDKLRHIDNYEANWDGI